MNKTSNNGKVALVTGASAGIGRATALALLNAGYTVIGTSRKAKFGDAVGGVRMAPCDVTSGKSAAAAVEHVRSEFGRLDLLVNNAGVGMQGAAEECSVDYVHALFDTNVYGVVRMTNGALPIMRDQGSGRIVNLSSILGLIPAPYGAYYSATKHAIEGYSESLDHEVRGFGVRVVVVEPGFTKSSFEQSMSAPDTPLALYDAARANAARWIANGMKVADSPKSVAETIVRAATAPNPRPRYTSGKVAGRLALLRRLAPASIFDKGLRKDMRLV